MMQQFENEKPYRRSKAAFLPVPAMRYALPQQQTASRLIIVFTLIVSLFVWFLAQGSDPVLELDSVITRIQVLALSKLP
jgi:hypothetical protein